jgi:hypothetical protein
MLLHDAILSSEVKGWLQELCDRWQIPGLSVSVVSKIKDNGCHGEVFTYGRRNAEGQSFTPEVRPVVTNPRPTLTDYTPTSVS